MTTLLPVFSRVQNAEATAMENLQRNAALAEMRQSYAPATVSAYRSDSALFTRWCATEKRQLMPASPETVAAFVDAMADAGRRPATIGRYVTSIATMHRMAEVTNPCTTQVVRDALKGMRRRLGVAQQQAAPLNEALVQRLLRVSRDRLRDLRHKAMLVVAYVALLRRSELVALQLADLHVEADGFATILIRRSKTDQEGAGAVVPIPADALRHVEAWIEAAGITDGPLFRAVRKNNRIGGALNPREVARFFKAMATRAELSAEEVAKISGHSTRVGSALDMVRYKERLPAIMQAGRWNSARMVGRYTARPDARDSAAMRIAGEREPF